MNIHITNLNINTHDAFLKELFAAYGNVGHAFIVRDKRNGQSKGTAFVEMPNSIEGSNAITDLDQTLVEGNTISVSALPFRLNTFKN